MKTLWQTAEDKRGSYPVRTHLVDSEGKPRFINRLVMEDSPYLLQHAHNPVNWYAWGSEAFAAAGTQGKPVFLSIGYSTCHWCHVMEEESFDNEAIAAILNQHFISIKLDREQHPDIDEYYMTAVQFISGHGGWPMSNFMLADGKPFYSATYFPPSQFAAVLTRIVELWQAQKNELIESAGKVSENVGQWLSAARASKELDLEHAWIQILQLLDREDRHWGGLAGAPKFSQEPLLSSLLNLARRDRNTDAAGFVFRALEAMARGGIYDQIGGGFHRYSVDAQWLVPHFEKMLYNQSQLSRLYLVAWQLTGNPFFHRITTQTLDYVLREMQLPEGGFYSATDADSDGEEGRFFIWTFSELKQLLGGKELALVQHFFDISETGNFEGANIFSLHNELYPAATADNSIAAINTLNTNTINQLDRILLKLRDIRSLRNPPLRDDKLIVAWSAAMATSLARAGWQLESTDYTEAARRAIENIWKCNFDSETGLQRIYLNANTSVIAQLEDYAALCEALLVLFDISGEGELLQRANLLAARMLSEYWNETNGGFFNNRIAVEGPLLARSSHAGDGATFSAIAMALGCLVSLHQRRALLPGDESDLEQRINQCIAAHAGQVAENPPGHGSFLCAVRDFRQGSCNAIQYAAAGRIKVTARRQVQDIEFSLTIILTIQIEAGWHLAAETAETFLPPTVVLSPAETAWELHTVEFPELSIDGVFKGDFNVKLNCRVNHLNHADHADQVSDSLAHSVGLILTLQACSNQLCLAQENLSFRL